jgi:hypothetical protein
LDRPSTTTPVTTNRANDMPHSLEQGVHHVSRQV